MGVANAVNLYGYDQLKANIYAKFGKVIELLGDDIVKEFMRDAQTKYYNNAKRMFEDMNSHSSDPNYELRYPAYLTFEVDPINDVFKPLYKKYYDKVKDKLIQKDFYHFRHI